VDLLPLGGHIVVNDVAARLLLLLILVWGIRVDGEVLVVCNFYRCLGAVGPSTSSPTILQVSFIAAYSGCRVVMKSGWERRRRRVVTRGWDFDLEIGTRKYIKAVALLKREYK
jgi:hypothetical protein